MRSNVPSRIRVLNPATESIDETTDVDAFVASSMEKGEVVIVGGSGAKTFDETLFSEVANAYRSDTSVRFVKTPAVSHDGKPSTAPLVIFKPFDEKFAELTSLEDVETISAFIESEKNPLVEELDQDNFKRLAIGKTPLAQFYVEEPDVLATYQETLYTLAKSTAVN